MKRKGRILSVKPGYNPNSSAIGTLLTVFPAAVLGSAVVFNIVSAVILSGRKKNGKKRKKGG